MRPVQTGPRQVQRSARTAHPVGHDVGGDGEAPGARVLLMKRSHRTDVGIALGLLAGNLLLLAPYLATDLSSQIWNNDWIHIGLARMYRERAWSWNALWYCGVPFSYAYLPLFPTLVAAAPVSSLGRAYHLVSGLGYALVPATLYLMGLKLFRMRFPAVLAAVTYSLFPSPVYIFSTWANLARDFSNAPWPFVTLVRYAEQPHIFSLALITLAVAAAWQGRWILASLVVGAVFLTNWLSVVSVLIALAAVAVAQGRNVGYGRAAVRVFVTAAVGYGLAAFWITAGYFHTMVLLARVLRYGWHTPVHTPTPWSAVTWAVLVAAAALMGVALWRRTPPLAAFLLTWLALSGAPVAAFALAGNHLLPTPWRYVMEFNMCLVLAGAALGCVGRRSRILLVAAAVALSGFAVRGFLPLAWQMQQRDADVQEMVSFQIADWLARNAAGSRVFTAGELNGALNVWTDVALVVGGTAQGVSNPLIVAAHKEVSQGCARSIDTADLAQLWLRALHSRYVVVHGASSREYFHWFVQPEKFSTLPVAWTNGAGDTIYRLPPPELHDAVIVDAAALDQLPPLRSTDDVEFLTAYVAWAQGKRPANLRWTRDDTAELEVALQPNEAVLVKVNYDRGWQALGARMRPDPIGFLLLDLPTGHHKLKLRYGAAWDVWLGRAITLATIVLLLARIPTYVVALVAVIPAVVAYAFVGGMPPRTAVAETTLRRIQPPIITAEGIVDGVTYAPPPLVRGRPASIFGHQLGDTGDRVRVWVENREAHILYHDSYQVNIRVPNDAPPAAEIAVEVNGCRGNSFLVSIRD